MTGSFTPRTYPSDTVTVRCEMCDSLGRYRRDTLLDRFGLDRDTIHRWRQLHQV